MDPRTPVFTSQELIIKAGTAEAAHYSYGDYVVIPKEVGSITYRVVEVDEEGVWGVEIRDTTGGEPEDHPDPFITGPFLPDPYPDEGELILLRHTPTGESYMDMDGTKQHVTINTSHIIDQYGPGDLFVMEYPNIIDANLQAPVQQHYIVDRVDEDGLWGVALDMRPALCMADGDEVDWRFGSPYNLDTHVARNRTPRTALWMDSAAGDYALALEGLVQFATDAPTGTDLRAKIHEVASAFGRPVDDVAADLDDALRY